MINGFKDSFLERGEMNSLPFFYDDDNTDTDTNENENADTD